MATKRNTPNEILCEHCFVKAALHGETSLSLLSVIPPFLPDEYATSHKICNGCQNVHRVADRHDRNCEFLRAATSLRIAGWATPLADQLRNGLRRHDERSAGIMFNVLTQLVLHHRSETALLVPVPMGSLSRKDPFAALISSVGEDVQIPVLRAVVRRKTISTRHSVAQVRRAIASTEYALDTHFSPQLAGKTVLLVDDTVTTGCTILGVAKLIRLAGAQVIMPLAFDRTISARLRQRIGMKTCGHVISA